MMNCSCWYAHMLVESGNSWKFCVSYTHLHTCLSPHIRYCHGKPEFQYDADVLGHIWNVMNEGNTRILGCYVWCQRRGHIWNVWMKATPGYWVAKYDADILGHTWNVLIEGNAKILGCQIWCRRIRLYIGWHDKWGQHGWLDKWSNARILGCWDQHVEWSCVLMLVV